LAGWTHKNGNRLLIPEATLSLLCLVAMFPNSVKFSYSIIDLLQNIFPAIFRHFFKEKNRLNYTFLPVFFVFIQKNSMISQKCTFGVGVMPEIYY
jgi:hypothetical protein